MKTSSLNRFFKNFDYSLFISVMVILAIGLLSIYSSTKTKVFSHNDFYKQIIFIPPALFACFSVAAFDYYKLRNYSNYIYWANVGLLAFVLLIGHSAYGAQRWIGIGGIAIQPSELAKIALIITLADILNKKVPQNMRELLPVFFHFILPAFLIFKQPDLGTTLSLVAIMFGMLYGSGLSLLIFFVLISPAISAALSFINFPLWIIYLIIILGSIIYIISKKKTFSSRFVFKLSYLKYFVVLLMNIVSGLVGSITWSLLKDYQKKRILIFLNPDLDPLGAGYHISQSQIAIGSGGLLGKGLFHGTQTQLNFIPFQHTDFIFCTISEEFGFGGGVFMLLIYLYVIWRGLRIANSASDDFGKYIAIGIVSMFTFHIFVNIGMVAGMLPAKGLPLPLMSYGGTFLVITMISIGLLESISIRRKRMMFSQI
ncbi:MAG: rod shape-determining protein RodA [Candidatus Sericytochromatia bacterium]|nr:rod shape-determining protein RodA [Candidatus Sericytochromatia bacterium]